MYILKEVTIKGFGEISGKSREILGKIREINSKVREIKRKVGEINWKTREIPLPNLTEPSLSL
ncbi:hypothetical protein AM1BK_11140 [Neobacillus kokaensis]|uniref:Uncharacterized protein n=1 Tax=Neobacillus kokaensis TaxID=2759023 RepID=A0ABQ3N8H8_9BACI|nr:hypothetical protein AM1BK_11140 [Neobacillus kokaensis]